MLGRVLPFVVLVMFLGLALGLMSIPFLVRQGTPVVSPSASLAFSVDLGGGGANGRLQVAVDRSFRTTFRLNASSGDGWAEIPVSVTLMMPDHAMSPLEPALSRGDGGEFTASGTLPMSGRWKLLIQTPDGSATVPFRIDE